MQTRAQSLLESVLNVASGFFISLLVWQYFIVPIWHFEVTTESNLRITLVFTVVSVVRSYIWRRVFTWLHRN